METNDAEIKITFPSKVQQRLSLLEYAVVENVNNKLVVTVPSEKVFEIASILKNEEHYDFLFDIVGMDYGYRDDVTEEVVDGKNVKVKTFGITYYLSQTENPAHLLVLKTSTEAKIINVIRDIKVPTGNKSTGEIIYTNEPHETTEDLVKPEIPSVSSIWQAAYWYEREVYDFLGVIFIDHPDLRRIFLRIDWKGYPLRKDYNPQINPIPLKSIPIPNTEESHSISIEDGHEEDHVHQLFNNHDFVINFGPQHPAMHGVLHLRVSVEGEEVKKIVPNFGYIHRGIEKMCETYTYPQILHLVDRLDYLSGTMNRHAVCLCCENALGIAVPERAQYVRTIFDELTRIASHLLGWGCMCMDMGSITAFVYGMRDREKIMDIFEETAGGRLMPNYNVIGGLANDIHPNFQKRIKEFIPYMRKMLKEHHLLFTGNPIATGRMNKIGILKKEDAISIGATGPSSRASGWSNDIRKIEPYAAYDKVNFEEVLRPGCDSFDRYIIRLDEIEQSLRIIEQLVDNIPEGAYFTKPPKAVIRLPEGEFIQRVENARGQFGVHITSRGDKTPYRVKFRSPSLVLVGALTKIVPKNKIADLIMIGASLDYVIPCIDR